jgi:phage shock protein C
MEEAYMSRSGRLYRDRENGLILGVCAGLAEHFDMRAIGVRVIAVALLVFLFWPAVLAYVTAGVLLRDRPLPYRGREREERFWRSGSFESERWS